MSNSQHCFHVNKLSSEHIEHTTIFMNFHLHLIYSCLKIEFCDKTPLCPERH